MEKKLVLIRHAKSDWSSPGTSDFDRPLNDRGKKDAPMMGKRLKDRGMLPDLIISSPAKRAATTAKLIANEVQYDPANIVWIDRLYHCHAYVFEEVITQSGIADDIKTVFVFAHNPGITHFAMDSVRDLNIDMPTCSMVAITFNAEHWHDFANVPRSLLFFDYPKNQ